MRKSKICLLAENLQPRNPKSHNIFFLGYLPPPPTPQRRVKVQPIGSGGGGVVRREVTRFQPATAPAAAPAEGEGDEEAPAEGPRPVCRSGLGCLRPPPRCIRIFRCVGVASGLPK